MAKIYGVELKNITNFKGHEGEPLIQGNIYFNKKKVGYYSQDYMCGPDTIDFDSKDIEKSIKELSKKFLEKYPYGLGISDISIDIANLYRLDPVEGLMIHLCELIYAEKDYKKAIKKGYKYAVYTKETERSITTLYYVYKDSDLDELKAKNHFCYVMSSLDQFNIINKEN